jgi:hypothetical protein
MICIDWLRLDWFNQEGFMRNTIRVATAASIMAFSSQASAGCRYVDRADLRYFNNTSQVIIVRDGPRTVMSVLSDRRADVRDFALVIPVPQVLRPGQVRLADRAVFDRLDAYSAPRLVEYMDEAGCDAAAFVRRATDAGPRVASTPEPGIIGSRTLGVNVEVSYAVGEYDTVIVSAQHAEGLETWLAEHGYRISPETARALRSYVREGMKFFVARVNPGHISQIGLTPARPLQLAFESEKFTLPLRVGMLNAAGPQDLVAYFLTRKGRVEATNYRTVKLPTGIDLPAYNRGEFGGFYRAVFDRQARKEGQRAVFTEYVWDASSCGPCTADPLSSDELRRAGVFWLDGYEDASARASIGGSVPPSTSVMLTRLHVRYTPQTFPEDLMLQETSDRQSFQARYYLHRGWIGPYACPDVRYYEGAVRQQDTEPRQLVSSNDDVRSRLESRAAARQEWWQRLAK